jgi:hypothetical protein
VDPTKLVFVDECRGDGTYSCGGGLDHSRSLRSLSRACAPSRVGRGSSDNHGQSLPVHKPGRVRELIEGRGCQLLYLPGYSPEYNPIEEAFSKIKEILCAEPVPGLARSCSRRWAKHYPRSASGMPRDSSSTPVTILWVNYYETRCQMSDIRTFLGELLPRTPFLGEVRRMPLPRTPVNRGRRALSEVA